MALIALGCRRLTVTALLLVAMCVRADPVISEFMAANAKTLADEDGAFSDWVEIFNPDDAPVDLTGWYLTDAANNKTKWQFPAVTIASGGYLIVFASNKDRREPAQPLHTNFALSASGEYLGLIKPDGRTVASEFAPAFPAQTEDISYGRVTGPNGPQIGFLRRPTPGAENGGLEALSLAETVAFSSPSRPFLESVILELSGAAPGQQIRYVAATGANAAAAEPTANSPAYNAPLTLTTTTVIRAAVFSIETGMRGPVKSAHFLKLGADLVDFTSQLPILVLDDLGAGALERDGIDHASWLYGYDLTASRARLASAPSLTTPLVATVRGSSSAGFAKKGYNVKLRDDLGGKRSLGLFDLPAHEKWALVAPWAFDQNFINNAFVYALSNRLGRWAPRTRLVEMFFNTGGDELGLSDYAGIYVITDRIEVGAARVNISNLSRSDVAEPDITGGYIIKIDPPDPDEISWTTRGGVPEDAVSDLVLVSPRAEDVAPAQLAYIQDYVQRMENALHNDRGTGWRERTYLDYLDRSSWVDHHILNVLTNNPDALYRSAYFTKHRGGKLMAGPVWDFDRALGSSWDERGSVIDTWSGIDGHVDVWTSGWWGILAGDPEFRQEWVDRWQSLRRTELSTAQLAGLAQSLADSVGGAAAARDAARWPDTASPYGDYAAQIAHLKAWLVQRTNWIDRQFVAAPGLVTSGGMLTFTAPADAVLIYTIDGSDPRSLGGEIAPNAIISAGPVTVAASANVHVRSYNERLKEAFPGTPWSSAAGGGQSSPLSPLARLTNLSSRALVGTGDAALFVGVVVADTEGKPYLVRAVGPGLAAFGATATVADPQLSIVAADGVELIRNHGWSNQPGASQLPGFFRSVGAFPLMEESADSAVVSRLAMGSYTIQINTPSNQPGVGLAELYELDDKGRTMNLSTRAYVQGGDGTLIGGFVVKGPAHQRLLIRAVGPTLGSLGVAGALADPVLTVHAGGQVVATNDRWQDGDGAVAVSAATQRVGAFGLKAGGEDAALLVTLAPGAYTVELKGKDEGAGVALLEIYTVP